MNAPAMKLPAQGAGSAPKKSGLTAYIKMLSLLTCTWLIPASWVALSPPFARPVRAAQTTRDRLATMKQAMHVYFAKNKKAPADLNTLRAFAHAEKIEFDPYDAFAQRFVYTRLDGKHYIMRSFGADGVQNHPGAPIDMGIVSWGPRPAHSPVYAYATNVKPAVFPAVLLAGAESPDGAWLARIFVDQEGGTRQLLVRHQKQAGLFMSAPHDRVEEFVWLPNGRQIVYTATGSTRHRDGLYLWDLRDDSIVNLVDSAGKTIPLSPAVRAAGVWLSLAGVKAEGPTVYAYYAPRNDGALDPTYFFSKAQLAGFVIGTTKGTPVQALEGAKLDVDADQPPYTQPLDLGESVGLPEGKPAGLPVQRRWLTLTLQGEMEQTLLQWHEFIERESDSPLFPYSLWLLSSLYSESFSSLVSQNNRDADVLRTYGTEIARALVNFPTAPSYLRGLALHTYEHLMEAKPLPYRFAQLTVKDAGAPQGAVQIPSPAPAPAADQEAVEAPAKP